MPAFLLPPAMSVLSRCEDINYTRGSLNSGTTMWFNVVSALFGWWTMRCSSFEKKFHTYSLEWPDKLLCVCAHCVANSYFPFYFAFFTFEAHPPTSTRDCSTCLTYVSTCPFSSAV